MTDNDDITPETRQYLARIGAKGGKRAGTPEARSIRSRLNAAARWRIRRLRFGPSGQRQKPYVGWRIARNLPPVNEPELESVLSPPPPPKQKTLNERLADLL